jgi:hypothetical protein
MAYTLTTITIRPTAKVFYPQSGGSAAAAATTYRAWVKTNAGFMTSYSITMAGLRPASHVAVKNVSVWESLADYNAFVAARATQAYYVASQAYNLTNGLVSIDSQTRG